MLPSINISKEKFKEEFLKTLRAGIIKRNDFINWNKINTKHNSYSVELEFFSELMTKKDLDKLNYLRDSLLASDEPFKLIKLCFELLAHTQDQYVSWEDNINIKKLSEEIKNDSTKAAENFVQLLDQLGFLKILTSKNIYDYFKGVLVGLETHRRKNVGGTAYVDHIRVVLEKITNNLNKKNYDINLIEEEKIDYENSSQSKKVDFAITSNNKILVGIEVNFYTNTGSKPTEIKRSYGEVNRKLNKLGIQLVWITDGFGYTIMKKSLGDAFEIHKNTYNTHMLEKYFEKDIESLLKK